jgi:hypothetical protein
VLGRVVVTVLLGSEGGAGKQGKHREDRQEQSGGPLAVLEFGIHGIPPQKFGKFIGIKNPQGDPCGMGLRIGSGVLVRSHLQENGLPAEEEMALGRSTAITQGQNFERS